MFSENGKGFSVESSSSSVINIVFCLQLRLLIILFLFQANSNARDGRVMIFNLVEAAQEFLSEIVPVGQSQEPVRFS